jgi:chemotaxis protein MotB
VVRRRRQEEPQARPTWLMTFNDLRTLLLTFFVLLFSMISMEGEKMAKLTGELSAAFGPAGIRKQHKEQPNLITVAPKDSEKDYMTKLPQQQIEMAKDEKTANQVTKVIPSGESGKEPIKSVALEAQARDLEQAVKGLNCQWGFDRSLTFRLPDTVLFDQGKAEIRPQAVAILNKLGEITLKVPKYQLLVIGHTDDVPIRTTRFPSNWELSAARASAVVRYFAQKGGLDPSRMAASGYGSSWPVVPNDNPEHRAANRRVEIKLIEER